MAEPATSGGLYVFISVSVGGGGACAFILATNDSFAQRARESGR